MDQSETITKELTDDDKLIKLVSTQNFDGSFKLEAQLAELVSSSIDDIRKGNHSFLRFYVKCRASKWKLNIV